MTMMVMIMMVVAVIVIVLLILFEMASCGNVHPLFHHVNVTSPILRRVKARVTNHSHSP
jgi:uncharacterized membrane protein